MPSACFQCVDWLAVENMQKACPYGLLVIMLRFGVGIIALYCYLYAFGICCVGIISDPLRGSTHGWGIVTKLRSFAPAELSSLAWCFA